ncbi:MAG: prephenate dehydrogenase/arogenate dehydrogenase family protein [Turneriella sp.]|nr:prephenate dehydrogenase/arogenate dehydrogenase family protein [Turneriella sp.]
MTIAGPAAKPSVFIWGMGLIGASLGLRLKEAGYQVSGSVRSEKSRAQLAAMGFADIAAGEAESLAALQKADILALGLNLPDCYGVIDRILTDSALAQRLTIFDMCSTKAEICEFMRTKHAGARFVGIHPMAGKETTGPAAAEAKLFEGATVFVIPHHDAAVTQSVTMIWQTCGARTAVIDPAEHDRTMAYVSHGLHLVACIIAEMSGDVFNPDLGVYPAAGSFRDMTRIAGSSGEMWRDITFSNKKNVAAWLRKLGREATELADGIESGSADIPALFQEAKKARDRIMHK